MPGMQLSQQEIEAKLTAIAARLLALEPAKISPEARLQGELPFDSLGLAEFMMEIEEAFDIEIADRDLARAFPGKPATIRTVAMLIVEMQKR
jgi:acyl carrier protein